VDTTHHWTLTKQKTNAAAVFAFIILLKARKSAADLSQRTRFPTDCFNKRNLPDEWYSML